MHDANPTTRLRRRQWLLVCALLVITLGLVSRSTYSPFPALMANYPGDALWALLVFILIAIVKPGLAPARMAWMSLLIAYGVELLQLYQAPWIITIRATTLGHLVLGSGFDWLDLCAYTVGVGMAYLIDLAGEPSFPRRARER